MGYSYSVCYCRECLKMDLTDRNKYDSNYAYCTAYHKYYPINDKACSTYFEYDESRNKSGGGCYITTIVCDILGHPDNCETLTILRNFRENYMRLDETMISILIEYDMVGPIISEKIKESINKKTIAEHLFSTYLKNVVEKLKNQKFCCAIEEYTKMVNLLTSYYEIDCKYDINEIDYDQNQVGKGHKVLRKEMS